MTAEERWDTSGRYGGRAESAHWEGSGAGWAGSAARGRHRRARVCKGAGPRPMRGAQRGGQTALPSASLPPPPASQGGWRDRSVWLPSPRGSAARRTGLVSALILGGYKEEFHTAQTDRI